MINRDGILALVSDPDVSHTAWRVTRVFQRLREVGVDAQVRVLGPAGTDGVSWNPQMMGLSIPENVGVIVLPRMTVIDSHRRAFEAWAARKRPQGVVLVYETDDDCYSEAWIEHHAAIMAGRPGADSMLHIFRDGMDRDRWVLGQVDAVTVSTEHLAGIVRQYTSSPVLVVPNAIDVEAFRAGLVARPIWHDLTTIGWAGGMRPEADAEPVAEAWRRIAARYPDVHFVIAGWQPRCLVAAVPEDRLFRVPYADMASYPAGMQVTIGCCSAADTPFNRSRGPGKAWEYAIAGAAVVGTKTVYRGCVGLYGHHAETADEWEAALSILIEKPPRRRWNASGTAEHVERHHALSQNLWRWQDAYRAIRAALGVTA